MRSASIIGLGIMAAFCGASASAQNQQEGIVFPGGAWSITEAYGPTIREKIPVYVWLVVKEKNTTKKPWATYSVGSPTQWRGVKVNLVKWCEKNKYQCREVDAQEKQIKVYLEPIPVEPEAEIVYPKGTGTGKK